eukprot:13294739-Alexandrium_andersonii.AAC.1
MFVMKEKLMEPLLWGHRPLDPPSGASGAPEAPVGWVRGAVASRERPLAPEAPAGVSGWR